MPPLLSELKEQSQSAPCVPSGDKASLRRASYVKIKDLALPHNIDLDLLQLVMQNGKNKEVTQTVTQDQHQHQNQQEDSKVILQEDGSSLNNLGNESKGGGFSEDKDNYKSEIPQDQNHSKHQHQHQYQHQHQHQHQHHSASGSARRKDSEGSSISVSATGNSGKFNGHQRQNASSEGYNLCVLVRKVDVVVNKLRVDRSRVRLAEVEVGDETGCMSLRARDEQIDVLEKISQENGAVVLRNCTVELYQGRHLRLAVTKWGKLCCYPDNVESTPDPPTVINRDVNLSLVDLNLMQDAINESHGSSIGSPNNRHQHQHMHMHMNVNMHIHEGSTENGWFDRMPIPRDAKYQHPHNHPHNHNHQHNHNHNQMKKQTHGRRAHNKKYNHNDNPMIQSYPTPYFTGDGNMMMPDSTSFSSYYSAPRTYILSSSQGQQQHQHQQQQQRRSSRRGNYKEQQQQQQQQQELLLQQQQLHQLQQMQQIYFQQQERQHRMYVQHQQHMQQAQAQASPLLIPNLMHSMSIDSGSSGPNPNVNVNVTNHNHNHNHNHNQHHNQHQHQSPQSGGLNNMSSNNVFHRMENSSSSQPPNSQPSHPHQHQSQQAQQAQAQAHAAMQLGYNSSAMHKPHLNPYDSTIQMVEPSSPHSHSHPSHGMPPPQQQQQQQPPPPPNHNHNHPPIVLSGSQEWHEMGSPHVSSESPSKSSNQNQNKHVNVKHQNAMMHPPHHQVQQNQYGYYSYPPPHANQMYGSPPHMYSHSHSQNVMFMTAPSGGGGGVGGPSHLVLPEESSLSNNTEKDATTTTTTTTKTSYAEKAARKDNNNNTLGNNDNQGSGGKTD